MPQPGRVWWFPQTHGARPKSSRVVVLCGACKGCFRGNLRATTHLFSGWLQKYSDSNPQGPFSLVAPHCFFAPYGRHGHGPAHLFSSDNATDRGPSVVRSSSGDLGGC